MIKKNMILENEYELADTMLGIFEEESMVVTCIAHYKYIKDLLKALIVDSDNIDIAEIELEPDYLNGYDKEFMLSIGKDGKIWVEKSYSDYNKDYLWLEDDIIFIHDDCNSKIFNKVDNEDAMIIYFDYCGEVEEFRCNGDCAHCEFAEVHEEETDLCECEEDDMHGFSFSKDMGNEKISYSFYSTDVDMVERMRKELIR